MPTWTFLARIFHMATTRERTLLRVSDITFLLFLLQLVLLVEKVHYKDVLRLTFVLPPASSVIAKTTNFSGSNLQGCRFYKAYLARANFEGADLRGASLEDTSMDDANLRGANAAGAYFSASIVDIKDFENADFSEAQFPIKALPLLCSRSDAKGAHPVTGVDTRDSLMCP
jgi:uncharacterized protein YjbI with pentapeptide repeats